jgi:methionyl-tRNA formyltransferase
MDPIHSQNGGTGLGLVFRSRGVIPVYTPALAARRPGTIARMCWTGPPGRLWRSQERERKLTIGMFLMTEKGLRVLETVLREFGPGAIAYVVGARDSAVANDHYDDIASLCARQAVPFFDRSATPACSADYHFAISWRWIIANAPRLIVLHDSLLPKYRGFAPLPTALINGEREVGVTALFASEEYDRGEVLGQKRLEIAYPTKIQTVIERLSKEYAALVADLCRSVLTGHALMSAPQDETQASYSLWRDEEDYRIVWAEDADRIKRFIDSVGYPYSGGFSEMNGRKVRVLDAAVEADVTVEDRHPGKIIFLREGTPVVVCGAGLLRITDLRDDATGQSLLPLRKFRVRFK